MIGVQAIVILGVDVDLVAGTSGSTDMGDGVDATGLAAAMNTSKFASPSPLEESFLG